MGMNTHMNGQIPIWRLALGGVIAGAALFFIPFLLPLIGVLLLGMLFFRIVGGGPRRRMHMAMAWQDMSEEQRATMRGRFNAHRCGRYHMQSTTENKPNA